jgi:TolA-binding protein
MLLLGIAKVRLSFEDFAAANLSLKGLIERFPKSDVIPEAIYYRGVNFYKKTNDLTELKKAYETLLTDYPDSSWAKRAAPYRLI